MKFEGIIPPIITPFNDDYTVDEKGFAEVVEYMIAGGTHAIIVGGTTGEYYALSPEERVRQFSFAKDVIGGRVPMICGVNDITTGGASGFAVAARDAGADALLIAAPYYSLPGEDELAAHCLAVDQAADLPIMLYNYPGRTGVNMGEEFLRGVSASSNFQCIKEASGDIDRLHLLVRDFSHIQLSCGCEDQALEYYVWGATSWVTPMGNFLMEEVVAFHNACLHERDFAKARAMMLALLPLTSTLEGSGKFGQSVKFSCKFAGLPTGPVRAPLQPVSKAFEEELHEILVSTKSALQAIMNGAVPGQAAA